ncbi:Surface polysaccharide O-acyltransferase, integral membrane enzyme [Actinopolymorpha cephalotaxi]|uniref:Surface polysaccharide O-acyltransferase, integral membrane enzyme n=1 Tax=Actinopolymorpha cephalotaxi TaxID=504797 RepID=A0A1I2WTF7_9ACTN|nr:acyltransferase [Actinopolymorpha cephalotaxi]NYH85121.1 surface polysaccharide O-acyltransferase-like enzyme [Actinopolymorpha cephalotaxi]SFH04613.1 Surface polysaccharide O-acyltransferase, integral membrane enzyme [Actinopolymorpha cephalotaxi]
MSSAAAAPAEVVAAPASTATSDRPARRYVPWLSWVRVVATIAVVACHVCTHLAWEWGKVSDREWHFGNLVTATSRFSVPIFVMASGAVLLQAGRNQSLRDFYARRASRLAIPLLAWSAFYIWFGRWTTGQDLAWSDFPRLLLLGQPYYHLYFLFVIFGLYLITPFLRIFVDAAPRRYLVTGTALIIAVTLFDKLHRVFSGLSLEPNAFSYFLPWIGYYLLGYVLLTMPMPASRRRVGWIAGVTFAVTLLANVIGTWVLYMAFANRYGLMLYHYQLLGPMIMAIAMVFLMRAIFGDGEPVDATRDRAATAASEKPKKRPVGLRLADLTLGIYLIHPIPVAFVREYQPRFSSPWSSIGYHSAGVVVVLLLCAAAAWLLLRVPYVRRLV